jgi:hypothetical protein
MLVCRRSSVAASSVAVSSAVTAVTACSACRAAKPADLADLLRMNRLPAAWIAPPLLRELRDLVRHRAKLVALRTSLKNQVHAVLASAEVPWPWSDVFGGLEGSELLGRRAAGAPMPTLTAVTGDTAVMATVTTREITRSGPAIARALAEHGGP